MKDVFEWIGKATIGILTYIIVRYICDLLGLRDTWGVQLATTFLMMVGYEIGLFKRLKDYLWK